MSNQLFTELTYSSFMALSQEVWLIGGLFLLMMMFGIWAWKVQTNITVVTVATLLMTTIAGYALAVGQFTSML